MRDAAAAIEAALKELIDARNVLPEEFAVEIDRVIEQTKTLLEALVEKTPAAPGAEAQP